MVQYIISEISKVNKKINGNITHYNDVQCSLDCDPRNAPVASG